jgi:hypothetical protein
MLHHDTTGDDLMQTNTPAPAGWYPDPDQPHAKRYWDGRAWTEHRVAGEPPAGKKRAWYLIPLVAVALLLGMAVIASATEPDTTQDVATKATTATTAAPTTAAPATTERVTTTTTRPEPATTTTRPRPTTTTTRPQPTTTVDPLAADRAAMGAWASLHTSLIDDLSSATSDMADKATDYDVGGLGLACLDLSNAVDAAKATDPIPVDAVDVHWQAALYHYGLGADACIEGTTSFDADALSESASEITQAGTELDKASDAMQGYLP